MKKRFLLLFLCLLVLPTALFAQRSTGRGPRNYSLKITSNAPNAQVRITAIDAKADDQSGRAPLEVSLPKGNYRVTVEAPGYVSQTRDISLEANATEDFSLQLATGRVEIILSGDFLNMKVNNPRERIEIYDNGERLSGNGFTFELRPGQHTIQVVSGGLMIQKTIRIDAGGVYRLEPVVDLQLR